MLLNEMRDLCENENITQEELDAVHPAYCLLGFDKTDFCKLISTLGLGKWIAAAARWRRLAEAEQMLTGRENYMKNKARLLELEDEMSKLADAVIAYEDANRLEVDRD